jgi:hypothetical protein
MKKYDHDATPSYPWEGAGDGKKVIEDFSDALSGCRQSIRENPQPGLAPSTIKGGQAPGFVLTRFQRSGRQPSQALREDDRLADSIRVVLFRLWKPPSQNDAIRNFALHPEEEVDEPGRGSQDSRYEKSNFERSDRSTKC